MDTKRPSEKQRAVCWSRWKVTASEPPHWPQGEESKPCLPHLFSVKVVFSGSLLGFFQLLAGAAFLGPASSGRQGHIFHRAASALKNSESAACFCYRTLEDVRHVINLHWGSAREYCRQMVIPVLPLPSPGCLLAGNVDWFQRETM